MGERVRTQSKKTSKKAGWGEAGKEGERKTKQNRGMKTLKDAGGGKERETETLSGVAEATKRAAHRYTPTEPSLHWGFGPLSARTEASPSMVPAGLTHSCDNLLPFSHPHHSKDPGAQPRWN